jgi:hypothetical protein
MLRRGQFRRCGRAEPAPPRGGRSKGRWPSGENPGITQKAIFSEGRTLCVRIARPYGSRGIARSSGANEYMVAEWGHAPARPISPLRACGGRPSRGGPSKLERPCGESPEMAPKAVFSEGRTLCVRIAGPDVGGFPAPDSGIK